MQESVPEVKRGVGRPKKVIKNPWGRTRKPKNVELNIAEIVEPTTYEEAVMSPQSEKWEIAMHEELKSLDDRNTWEISNKPENVNCIGSKWVYKVKTDSTGKNSKVQSETCCPRFFPKERYGLFGIICTRCEYFIN